MKICIREGCSNPLAPAKRANARYCSMDCCHAQRKIEKKAERLAARAGIRLVCACGADIGSWDPGPGRQRRYCDGCREANRMAADSRKQEKWQRSAKGAEWRRDYYERRGGREASRAQHLRRKFGLSLADFDAMVQAQGGRCAICRRDEPGGKGAWQVDHDHETGAVRSLLCLWCNTAIGKLGDDPAMLRAAAAYLESHRLRAVAS